MAGVVKLIRIGDDEVDRITELPVHLREHILNFLSLKNAVATSVLSSKWRYCWTGLRELKFDGDFWNFDRDSKLLLEHVKAIDRVLLQHNGPIREFYLVIHGLKDASMDINMWFTVLWNNHVQKIFIDSWSLTLPSGFFLCQELVELSLCAVELTLPSDFEGFANLSYLSLDSLYMDESMLERLISGCLMLETLWLNDLHFENHVFIKALNLKSFNYYNIDMDNIHFEAIPKLNHVKLLASGEDRVDFETSESTLYQFRPLSKIEELTFDFLFSEPLSCGCPRSTPTPFENLKSLTLISVDICRPNDVSFVLCLITSAPNLQNLTLYLESTLWNHYEFKRLKVDPATKLLKSEAKSRTRHKNLQTIKIKRFEGLPHESLLIKLLQTRCPKVKSINIEREL